MTDIRVCIELIRRLRVCNYFATLDEGSIGELAKMLVYAYDESIAAAAVSQWLEQETERPTPADIRRLVAFLNEARTEEREAQPEPEPAYRCSGCQDTGLRGGTIVTGNPEGGTPWSRCSCVEGAAHDRAYLDKLNADWERLRQLAGQPKKEIKQRLRNVGEIYRDV